MATTCGATGDVAVVTALLRLEYSAVDTVGATAAFHAAFGTGEVWADRAPFAWEQLSLVDDGITATRISASGHGIRVRIDRSPELLVFSVREGSLELEIAGTTTRLERGDLGLVPNDGSAELRLNDAHFEAFSMPPTSLARLLGVPGGPLRLVAPRVAPRSATLGRYVTYAANLLTSRVFATPEIYERDLVRAQAIDALTAATIEAFELSNRAEEAADRDSTTVRRAVAYMREHLSDPIAIPDVADAAGLSVRGLQLVFQRRFGTTPLMHLRQMRLEAARQSLHEHSDEGTTIAEVARRYGYSNSGRFATHYRNEFGESPGAALQRIRDARRVPGGEQAVSEEAAAHSH